MGRGASSSRREATVAADMLQRARLQQPASTWSSAMIARAIRAELWFGSLSGARTQAQLGGTVLAQRAERWRWPALLFLACGGEALQEAATTLAASIASNVEERMRLCEKSEPMTTATTLLELADVLGPLACASGATAIYQMLPRALELAARTGEQPADAPVEAALRQAGQRLEGWTGLARGETEARALLTSYDAPDSPKHGPLDWNTTPRLELLVALELMEKAGLRCDRSELRSLPASLHGASWSARSAEADSGQ